MLDSLLYPLRLTARTLRSGMSDIQNWMRGIHLAGPPAPSTFFNNDSAAPEGHASARGAPPPPADKSRRPAASRLASLLTGHRSTNSMLSAELESNEVWCNNEAIYQPKPDQMADALLRAAMATVGKPLPPEYNSYLLHVLEEYRDLRSTILRLTEENRKQHEAHQSQVAGMKMLAERWMKDEKILTDEIRRLRGLLEADPAHSAKSADSSQQNSDSSKQSSDGLKQTSDGSKQNSDSSNQYSEPLFGGYSAEDCYAGSPMSYSPKSPRVPNPALSAKSSSGKADSSSSEGTMPELEQLEIRVISDADGENHPAATAISIMDKRKRSPQTKSTMGVFSGSSLRSLKRHKSTSTQATQRSSSRSEKGRKGKSKAGSNNIRLPPRLRLTRQNKGVRDSTVTRGTSSSSNVTVKRVSNGIDQGKNDSSERGGSKKETSVIAAVRALSGGSKKSSSS
ncbi:MAG: hypothetical protein M1825_000094 [Sarcosagium campestre]|nr:MAG: hypothetical protein M1825_000094 [Sarcosagium campestre]